MDSEDFDENNYKNDSKLFKLKLVIINLGILIIIMTAATFLSFLFRLISFHESNIIIAYILGVLLVAKQTDGYFYGILASGIGVLTFNFFFTEPYYTLATYRPDYPVTFIIMLLAAIITSTLTARVKQEARLSSLREKRTQILYQINKSLLKVRSINEIVEVCGEDIAKLFNRSVIISMVNSANSLEAPYIYKFDDDLYTEIFNSSLEKKVINNVYSSNKPAGTGTNTDEYSSAYYIPIKGQSSNVGVIGVSCFKKSPLSDEQKYLLEAVTAQIALAAEREKLWEKQQKSKMEVESERLRSNLLRGISHDLRTPLTGILGATSTIIDNYEVLGNSVKQDLLQDIYEETSWLIHSIENILSLTRIDGGRIEIKKNMEAVEEIIGEAVSRVKKLTGKHTIKINIPGDLILIPIDGMLIEQVFVNLLDNAVKYTPEDSIITVSAKIEKENIVFEVSDNGDGIPEESLPLIFDRFYTGTSSNKNIRHGTGLGLAICKSIITAHGGKIYAYNNLSGGAAFRFILPARSESNG
jgi:two-component system, OmpR family, sensor histidine kinase KdpD